MKQELEKLREDLLAAVKKASSSVHLEDVRVEFLGRKGKMAELMKKLPALEDEMRKEIGLFANDVKMVAESAFVEALGAMEKQERASREQAEWIDLSMPGTPPNLGHLHLTTQAIDEIVSIFSKLGFVRTRHPEVDWDWYAFEALNMPKDHPARDEWETFFIADENGKVLEGEKGKIVLTPHTSNGQPREMEKGKLPIRMININKTYRRQSDPKHIPMFHQFEGLMVDEHVTVTELKGVLDVFAKRFFGTDREVRLRPFHFRFVEPGFEIDINCGVCKGSGEVDGVRCKICKDGWHELGGAGMVHPNVLKAGGIDPEKYTGFAFGWGVERTMAMKSGVNIDDIRVMYRNDLRFLEQF